MDNENISQLLCDFYNVSGMEISLLNENFHTVASSRCPHENICSLIHSSQRLLEVCKASDIEHLNSVSESGEGELYTCPFGITEAIVPIFKDDRIASYLITTLGISDGDYDFERVCAALGNEQDIRRVSEAYSLMRRVSDKEKQSYFNILGVIAKHISANMTPGYNDDSIGVLIKRYVKDNLDKKITLSDIALNLHCSTVTLTEHFKAEFGYTIMEYVTHKRMELAKKLLLSTNEPLRVIASMLGYPDVEYFSRTFKHKFGLPPGTWREENKRH